jgi:hypothetical protein
LCDPDKIKNLNQVLLSNLHPADARLLIENDALDMSGNPVLFAYCFDMPRIVRFNSGLHLQKRKGVAVCFDFQKGVLAQYFGGHIEIQTIDAEKFAMAFFSPNNTQKKSRPEQP